MHEHIKNNLSSLVIDEALKDGWSGWMYFASNCIQIADDLGCEVRFDLVEHLQRTRNEISGQDSTEVC